MSLRRKFILYLFVIHLPFAVLAVLLLTEHRHWLIPVEAFFVVSIVYGTRLIRGFFAAIDRVRSGARFMADSDFTVRFREVGHPELDTLIDVYNRMADNLREERIRQQEQNYFLEKVLAASPLGVVTMDFDGRIVSANPSAARWLGRAEEELVGQTLGDLDPPFGDALVALDRGASCIVALHGARRIKCERSSFLDRGFERDVVTLSELTEELRRTERAAYEKLIRLMSHEVNNTVAATNAILEACLSYRDDLPEDEREDFETGLGAVINRAERLNAFTAGFAEVVRLPLPRRAPCDVAALLEDVVILMRADAGRHGVEIDLVRNGAIGPVLLDRIQMEQVFVNILKNAREAIGENGRITVTVGERGGRAVAEIEDTGAGIDPEIRAQLFTPFFTSKEDGQGIGLMIVGEVLTRHGFDFSLDGPPGGPTTFTIWFTSSTR